MRCFVFKACAAAALLLSLSSTAAADADLALLKTAVSGPFALPGATINYFISIRNLSATAASGVVFTDSLPGNGMLSSFTPPPTVPGGETWSCTTPAIGATGTITCSAPSLSAGLSTVASLSVKLGPEAVDGTTIVNTATIAAESTDPDPTNNMATATVTVRIVKADLAVTNTASPAVVQPGADLTFTVTFLNSGPDTIPVTVFAPFLVPLPAGTTFRSATTTGTMLAACSFPSPGAATGDVSCTGFIGAGQFVTLQIVVRPDAGLPQGSRISATATAPPGVAGQWTDTNLSNNAATASAFFGSLPVVPALSPRAGLALSILLALAGLQALRQAR
ncbi:MAG TPA: hypothetical protein VKG01_01345 [Thermoanaerobaculia bacterium]|nr:hypothetical protein [Thermoanaerobaculia bacterium]